MTGFDEDRELEDFLAHRSSRHRRLAERDRSEPPPELDRVVLNKAREAINLSTGEPMYRAPRWALPVSLAATVVLALAVVMNLARVPHGGYPVAASASPAMEAEGDTADIPLTAPAAPRVDESAAGLVASNSAPALRDEMRKQAAEPRREKAAAPATALAKAEPQNAVQMPAEVTAASEEVSAAESPVPAPEASALVYNGAARGVRSPASDFFAIVPAKREAIASDEAKRADPQVWRREIERLRAAGQSDAADRELARFRKAFPADAPKPASRDPRPAQ
jgi:hypothetical protein